MPAVLRRPGSAPIPRSAGPRRGPAVAPHWRLVLEWHRCDVEALRFVSAEDPRFDRSRTEVRGRRLPTRIRGHLPLLPLFGSTRQDLGAFSFQFFEPTGRATDRTERGTVSAPRRKSHPGRWQTPLGLSPPHASFVSQPPWPSADDGLNQRDPNEDPEGGSHAADSTSRDTKLLRQSSTQRERLAGTGPCELETNGVP